uniref:Uncharacterized protein n=1 Tax=Arundo donax TaxID=35708 RepID=A0A0A8ZKK3_ARUDO
MRIPVGQPENCHVGVMCWHVAGTSSSADEEASPLWTHTRHEPESSMSTSNGNEAPMECAC